MEKQLLRSKFISALPLNQGPLSDLIGALMSLQVSLKIDGWSNIQISPYDTGDGTEYELYGDRMETDAELESRKAVEIALAKGEKRRKADKAEAERKEYERLKRKFES